MTFKTQLATDLAVFFNNNEFADVIEYTPIDGLSAQITAIVDRNGARQEPYIRGENTATAVIYAKISDISDPMFGDTFYFDNETWEMDPAAGVISRDANVLVIALRRVD